MSANEKITGKISIQKMERSCDEVCRTLKALSHPSRLMVLGHLLNEGQTVNELAELCSTSQSQMSHFLMRMRYEGLVECEHDGKYRRYKIADSRLVKLIRAIQENYCSKT